MEYTKEEIRKVQKHLAILSFKHLKEVDARTMTIFQKNRIFESLNPSTTYEEVLPILNNKDHPNRISVSSGPLFFYLIQKNPPQAAAVNLTELLFAKNGDIRKIAFDYFSNLEDKELPSLTTKTRTLLKSLGDTLLSTDDQKWRESAVAIYDALNED